MEGRRKRITQFLLIGNVFAAGYRIAALVLYPVDKLEHAIWGGLAILVIIALYRQLQGKMI